MRTNVFILGSCVSRDAFGPRTADRFQISDYVARTAWGSAFAEKSFPAVALERIESTFQRRMVELDQGKGLGKLLSGTTADVILLDLIDERFDVFINDAGAVCTVSAELLASGFQPSQVSGTLIRSGSSDFYELWEQGWCRLLSLLQQENLLTRVRVGRIFWSASQENGCPFDGGHTPERIARANRYLQRLYERLDKDLPPQQFIQFPDELLKGASDHQWGPKPFHYIKQFYLHLANALPERSETIGPAMQSAPTFASQASAPSGLASRPSHVVLQLNPGPLTEDMQWHDIQVPQGAELQIDCRIQSESPVSDRRAVLSLECRGVDGTLLTPAGFAISPNESVGSYRYLGTRQGSSATSFNVTLPTGFKTVRVGLRKWMADARLLLQDLRVSFAPGALRKQKPATILSVDVEALPGRAQKDSVERLIFGRFGDGKTVGIDRLCEMFDRVGAKATFFVDYSTCDIHGEKAIFAAAELLQTRGHDVQLHMHSEVLVRQRRWPHDLLTLPAFDVLDSDVARACLEYGVDRFQRNLGHRPRIFRPGGMKHSQKMVLAVKQAGIEAVSSIYRGRHDKNFKKLRDDPVIRWDNGVLEAPLDFALDPLVEWGTNRSSIADLLEARSARPLTSILIHSTSLLIRALDNNPPYFTGYCESYEHLLQEYLDWFAKNGDFITYSELLDTASNVRTIALSDYYAGEENGLEMPYTERQFDHASIVEPKPEPLFDLTITVPGPVREPDRLTRMVPAPQLPLNLAPGQRLESVTAKDASGSTELTYVLSGQKAYLMRQRCMLPGGTALQDALATIFRRHPRVTTVLAQSALEVTEIGGFSQRQETRRTFVLDLPTDFEDYRYNYISKKHRSDIERKERTVGQVLPGLRFDSLVAGNLDKAVFLQAAGLIEARLKHKVNGQPGEHDLFAAEDAALQWEMYRHNGEVVQLSNGSDVYAAALCLHFEQDCFFMASGHLEVAPKHSLGNILIYRLIQSLIERGFKRLHLGGGDFGYKGRYGAIEKPLCDYEFSRGGEEPLKSRVISALESGESLTLLEHDLAMPLENVLDKDFESAVGVDFDTVVENEALGTDGRARRYQATSRDAFTMMMKHVPFDADDVFVDIGCGKGKMLYYAAQLGYRRCVGMEIAEVLLHQARSNFERLRLPAEMVLMHRDASMIPMSDLGQSALFYLYNPFSEEIMQGFVACLLQSQAESPRKLRVVYCNALFEAPFSAAGFRQSKVFVDGVEGWRFGHAVIYERDPVTEPAVMGLAPVSAPAAVATPTPTPTTSPNSGPTPGPMPSERPAASARTEVPTNIAIGCSCRQSSVENLAQPDPEGANGAVNGRKTGQAAFTTRMEEAPWWQIDLGRSTVLDSVVVYNWDIVGLPYSMAGLSRARFLQIWGSHDAMDWALLHDRREGRTHVGDFGGIHNGPLCVPLENARCRFLKLTLAGGGVLQLDEVEVYSPKARDTDDAIRDLFRCASDLSFAMATRMATALDLPPLELASRVKRLGIELNKFSSVFLANLLVENHLADSAGPLLASFEAPAAQAAPRSSALPTAASAPPREAAPLLSFHIRPFPLSTAGERSAIPRVLPPTAFPQ